MTNITTISTKEETSFWKKFGAVIIVAMVYVLAFGAAFGIIFGLQNLMHPIIYTLIANISATIIVFIFSVVFNNVSFYDPYWSVQPILIAVLWMFLPQAADANPIRQGIILGVVSFWGLRLTINWIRTWKGLHHEDWRYVKYRKEYPKFHWFIAFFGLEMMSTLIVYLGSLAMYPALVTSGKAINFLDIIGMIVAIGATLIEFIADEQLKVFCQMREKNSQVMDVGLWGLSRHPNYFGEIAFWWGLFFFALAADLSWWWTIAGPIAMVLLFNFISIPLMEERQVKRRPEYEEYQEEVSRLIPWFSKN